ncbi:MAG TPA: transcription termination factor Rho [Patescibacteria group bacterium]
MANTAKPRIKKSETEAKVEEPVVQAVEEPKAEAKVLPPTPAPVPQAPIAPPVSNTPIYYSQSNQRPYNRPMQRPMNRPMYQPRPQEPVITEEVTGIVDILSGDGRAVARPDFKPGDGDIFISSQMSKQLRLRSGDVVKGLAKRPREGEQYWGMVQIMKINGEEPAKMADRPRFEKGTPIYPYQKIKLESGKDPLSTRLIDLVAPVGRGQRGIIVSPPKAGKTTVIKEIASGIAANYPEIHIMAVLVGERPEEVTDISRHISTITKDSQMPGETAASNFDEKAEDQTKVAEIALERAKRLVEMGKDVVILLDSVTRLARAYNLAIPTSGRTLSGGFDPAALYPPKKFFGAARKIENGGSLTIIGTALIDTGSRMDDLVYEEFKGTGNMELHLDRRLAERRIFPAIDVMRSGTRRDDLLFDQMEYQSIILMRRMLDVLGDNERTEILVARLQKTKTNKEFLASLKDGG